VRCLHQIVKFIAEILCYTELQSKEHGIGGKPFLKKRVRTAQAKIPPNPLSKKLLTICVYHISVVCPKAYLNYY